MDVAILGAGRAGTWRAGTGPRARGHRVARAPRLGPGGPHRETGRAWPRAAAPSTSSTPPSSRIIPQGLPGADDLPRRRAALAGGLGIAVMNPATAIERTVDKFYTSALLEAAGLPTPRTVVTERVDDALAAFRDAARRDRQAPVRLGRARHGASQRRGDRPSRVPRPGPGARRVLPAGGRCPTTAATCGPSSWATAWWRPPGAAPRAGAPTWPAARASSGPSCRPSGTS